jgi:hypothetical protein
MADSWIGPNVMIHLMMKISVVFSKKGKREKRKNKNKGYLPPIFIGIWF